MWILAIAGFKVRLLTITTRGHSVTCQVLWILTNGVIQNLENVYQCDVCNVTGYGFFEVSRQRGGLVLKGQKCL